MYLHPAPGGLPWCRSEFNSRRSTDADAKGDAPRDRNERIPEDGTRLPFW